MLIFYFWNNNKNLRDNDPLSAVGSF